MKNNSRSLFSFDRSRSHGEAVGWSQKCDKHSIGQFTASKTAASLMTCWEQLIGRQGYQLTNRGLEIDEGGITHP